MRVGRRGRGSGGGMGDEGEEVDGQWSGKKCRADGRREESVIQSARED